MYVKPDSIVFPQALMNFRYFSQVSRKVSLPGILYPSWVGLVFRGEVRLADPVKAVSLQKKGQDCME